MNIGILLPNWIGDVVMATPTLRALRERFGGDATFTGVMRPYVADVLAGTDWLDQTLFYDPRSRDRRQHTRGVVARMRKLRLDKLLLLTNSFRSGVIGWLSGARERYGYVRSCRGWLLNRRLYPPRQGRKFTPVSAVDYYLELARAAGCDGPARPCRLATKASDEQQADEVWNRFALGDAQRVVTLNSGGAYGAAKHWPAEHFAALAQRLVDDCDTAVLVLCGPAEREIAAEITRLADHPRVHSLAEQSISIGLSKACVRRSSLLVSTDSGPRHFAAAFDVPAVSLFGPTDPRWAINYHPREIHLHESLACQPCAKRVCPLGHHRCMRDLSVERVLAAAASLLKASADKSAA
ncbi:MAG: lipopolysaccharide heptosyltransferase II [Pirellulaceae bacterium]